MDGSRLIIKPKRENVRSRGGSASGKGYKHAIADVLECSRELSVRYNLKYTTEDELPVYYQIQPRYDDSAIILNRTWSTSLYDLVPVVSPTARRLYFEDVMYVEEDRDILWSLDTVMIFNNRVLGILESEMLTGWVAVTATVLRCRSELGARYVLRANGEEIEFDYSLSSIDTSWPPISSGRQRLIGLFFATGEEPAVDCVSTYHGIMVSERVCQLMLRHNVTGISFVRQSDAMHYGGPGGVAKR